MYLPKTNRTNILLDLTTEVCTQLVFNRLCSTGGVWGLSQMVLEIVSVCDAEVLCESPCLFGGCWCCWSRLSLDWFILSHLSRLIPVLIHLACIGVITSAKVLNDKLLTICMTSSHASLCWVGSQCIMICERRMFGFTTTVPERWTQTSYSKRDNIHMAMIYTLVQSKCT